MLWSRKKENELLVSTSSLHIESKDRVRQKFWAGRSARWSVYLLGLLLFIAVFADFIANEKPIYCVYEGKSHWPIFQSYLVDLRLGSWDESVKYLDWHNASFESAILPIIPYSERYIDGQNAGFRKPFGNQKIRTNRFRHWLGTDQIGRDIAAGMIHGTRISLTVGIMSMAIASIIGLSLGMIAGYFGDRDFKMTRFESIVVFVALFYIFYLLTAGISFIQFLAVFLLLIGFCLLIVRYSKQVMPAFLTTQISIPLDIIVMRIIEVINSFPALFTILAVVAVINKPSICALILIIGLIRWTGIARFSRAEMLKVRSSGYIQATKGLGVSDWIILWKSALPNILPPVLITISFGIAGAILLESFLSFLGIGVDPSQVSWGSLLQTARQNFENWWLALFPGIAIFITVTIFNLIGERLTEALEP